MVAPTPSWLLADTGLFGTVNQVSRYRQLLRFTAAFVVLGVGLYANGLRVVGHPWPEWMDGRFGVPLSWAMFADGLDRSVEVVGVVDVGNGRLVEVGREIPPVGPREWLWTSDDAWHIFAWFWSDAVDWEEAARLAREAAGADPEASVSFVVRSRHSDGTGGVVVEDSPLSDAPWGQP